jgi:hypothetical protein
VTERYWTAERVVEAIQRFCKENGRPPKTMEWLHVNKDQGYPCFRSVYGRGAPFKTWNEALLAAGLTGRSKGRASKYHEDGAVIQTIQDFVAKRGYVPTSREFRKVSRAAEVQYGNWGNAVVAAGFKPRKEGSHAVGQVICPNCKHEIEVS